MTGPVAQMVALTCHANALLAGREVGTFFPTNSTCQFCDRVVFLGSAGFLQAITGSRDTADTPDEWFRLLVARGATGVHLGWRSRRLASWLPDHMGAGLVGGGGLWQMEVAFRNGRHQAWRAQWVVLNQQAPDQRIWHVAYEGRGAGRAQPWPPADLAAPRDELREAIEQAVSFCAYHDLDGFATGFRDARRELKGKDPEKPAFHQDLAPAGFLSDDARHTLNACQHAWVFGGMGSWNDLGFQGEEQQRYDAVSERLYRAVTTAIQTAANTTCQG